MKSENQKSEFSYDGVYLATSFSGFMLVPFILSSNIDGPYLLILCAACFLVLISTPARSLILSRPHRKFLLSFYIAAPMVGYSLKFISSFWSNLIFTAILIAYIVYFTYNVKSIVATFKKDRKI